MSGPLDAFGYPAYSCAADGCSLEPVPGTEPQTGTHGLRCPQCGRHTDRPGAGVLGDAFDVIHRQWGLRGDPHAWRALRELLATTPTPTRDDAVRQAFVDGLREVADVDVDHSIEQQVHRPHLDHGGMSGGGVDVAWWRTKGVPLLVERAIARRPPVPAAPESSQRGWRRWAMDVVVWAVILMLPIGLVGGGGWLLYQRGVGTRVDATVLACDESGNYRRFGSTFRTECIAEWTLGGRTVIGGFEGGNGSSDVGRTVDATVRGDTAYSRSLGLPFLLLVLGLPFLALPVIALRQRRRDRRTRRADATADT